MSTQEFGMSHVRSSSVSLLAEATSGAGSAGINSIEDKLTRIEIYKNLTDYEDTLAKLIESVDKFHPNMKYAQDLIQADFDLFTSLETFAKYDEIDNKLNLLEDKRTAIGDQTKDILEILNECHDDLNNLPSLEQVEFEKKTILEQRQKVNSTILLDYATKLSKFTKIPPTFDKGTIGPNNFVWPGDDALRRGMLAMASLNSDKLTRIAGESDTNANTNPTLETMEISTEENNENTSDSADQKQDNTDDRRGSFVFNGNDKPHTSERKEQSDNEDIDLDLDLFNPDEF